VAEVLSPSSNVPNRDEVDMARVIRVELLYNGKMGGVDGYRVIYTVRGNRHEDAEVFAKDELDAYRMGNAIVRREVEAEDTADIEAFRQILKTFPDYPVPKKWRKHLKTITEAKPPLKT